MTDRELLEAAAKAAGIFLQWSRDGMCRPLNGLDEDWNPLTDDGDALRLAVKLGIHVSPRSVEVWRYGKEILNIFEDDEDYFAATRRAVVRAAASMIPTTQALP